METKRFHKSQQIYSRGTLAESISEKPENIENYQKLKEQINYEKILHLC